MKDLKQLVQEKMQTFDFSRITSEDVERVLGEEYLDIDDFGVLLSPAAKNHLEPMAVKAKSLTSRFFGNNICLYTPVYISNYCVNECSYCGYNCKNNIRRAVLSLEEIEREAASISETGLQDILVLTGESRTRSSVNYIGEAVRILRNYFSRIGIEVYPMDTDEYRLIHELGADFISVYQETYDPVLYDRVHLSGPKKVYHYRFNANDRALKAGFHGASFGALLGLGDFRKDLLACGYHAYLIQQKYPHAEISFSTPRIRPYPNREKNESDVHETELLQILLALRLFLPSAGISLSTRESAYFRDNSIGLGVTRMSAGVHTGVGGHSEYQKGDEQFHKSDNRSVDEMFNAILDKGYQPVFQDHIRV